MRKLAALSTALIIFAAAPVSAQAQTQDPIISLPEGQVILNISATERREVEQDLLVGTLSYIVTNREAAKVQNEINTVMAKALDEAKKAEEVKVNTGAYQVHETTDQRTKETQWRGQQSLTVKSKNAENLLDLVQDLQDMGLTMNGLNYTLSPETAVEIQDSLMEDALKQLQERANRAAAALGKSGADLRDVNVNSSGIPYQPQMRGNMAMMEASSAKSMAAPVAAAGETTITLNVNARAILKP